MNETLLDSSIIKGSLKFITEKSKSISESILNLIGGASQTWMARLIYIGIIVAIIWGASKITQKATKIILWVIAIILAVGLLSNLL